MSQTLTRWWSPPRPGPRRTILRSYNLHANCFISKPVDLDRFFTVVKSIGDFWLTVVRPPGEGA